MLEDNQTVGTQYLNGILEADGKKSLALRGGDPSVFPSCYRLHSTSLPSCPPPTHPLRSDRWRQHYAKTSVHRMSTDPQTEKQTMKWILCACPVYNEETEAQGVEVILPGHATAGAGIEPCSVWGLEETDVNASFLPLLPRWV